MNPTSEVVSTDVPHLRVVDDDLWRATKARQLATRRAIRGDNGGLVRARRPRHLFSGLTKCGVCGGGFVATSHAGHGRLECFNARDRGTCGNRRRIVRTDLEGRIFRAMRERLLDGDAFTEFCEGFTARLEELRREHLATLAGVQRELAAVNRQIPLVVDAVKQGFSTDAMRQELATLEARKVELGAVLETRPQRPALHPSMAAEFRTRVATFAEALMHDGEHAESRAALRGIVDRIVIGAADKVRLEGNLGAMLEMAAGRPLPQMVKTAVSINGCGGGI